LLGVLAETVLLAALLAVLAEVIQVAAAVAVDQARRRHLLMALAVVVVVILVTEEMVLELEALQQVQAVAVAADLLGKLVEAVAILMAAAAAE